MNVPLIARSIILYQKNNSKKHVMKKKLIIAMLFAAAAFVSSCDREVEEPADKRFYVDVSNLEFACPQGSAELVLVSGEDWAAVSGEEWITVSPSEGPAGSFIVSVSVDGNAEGVLREGEITLSSASRSITVHVKQNPEAIFEVSCDTLVFASEGGDNAFDVNSDYPFEIVTGEQCDWIMASTKSIGKTVTVSVTTNPLYSERVDSLMVRTINGKFEKTVIVMQGPRYSELQEKWMELNVGYKEDDRGVIYYFRDIVCPEGYRLPTKEDFEELITKYSFRWDDTIEDNLPVSQVEGMWFGLTQDDVEKAKYGDSHGCIFFPARGRSLDGGGMSNGYGSDGYYFSSSATEAGGLFMLHFNSSGPSILEFSEKEANRTWACAARCVKSE